MARRTRNHLHFIEPNVAIKTALLVAEVECKFEVEASSCLEADELAISRSRVTTKV
jgi:hypothetical protein